MIAQSVRRWYGIHKWTSLICTLFILIACLTGLPLIFHHEIDELFQRQSGAAASETEELLSTDTIVAKAQAARPELHPQLIFREPIEPHVTVVGMGKTLGGPLSDSELLKFNHYTGALLGSEAVGEGVMGFLTLLHVELLTGQPGSLFLGVMAIILFFSNLSGIILYAPFMRNRSFAVVRVDKGRRARWFDLHNALGVVILVWFLVVSATGVINTWASPLIQFWLLTEMKALTADDMKHEVDTSKGRTSLQAALLTAQEQVPGMELSFVMFPGSELSSSRHYLIFYHGTEPISSRLLKPVIVNGFTGELIATTELPWYMTALLISQPLHFGDYGGLGLKVAWAMLDIGAIHLLWSGLVLWWRKKDEKPEIELLESIVGTQ